MEGMARDYACFCADWVTELDRHDALQLLLHEWISEISLTSYNTTFVTSPVAAHSSLTPFLRSKSNEGSSSSSSRVNICFRTTIRPLLAAWLLNPPDAVSAGPISSSESQSSNFLNSSIRSVQRRTVKHTYLCILPILFVAFFLSTTFLSPPPCPPIPCCLCPNSAF